MVAVDRLHGGVRFALRDVLLNLRSTQHKQQVRVAIYGAGEAGAQLTASWQATTGLSLLTTRPIGGDPSTVWRLVRPGRNGNEEFHRSGAPGDSFSSSQ